MKRPGLLLNPRRLVMMVATVSGIALLVAAARGNVSTQTVDSERAFYNSLAVDGGGTLHASYWAESINGLKYARFVGSGGNCLSEQWDCQTVESADVTGEFGAFTRIDVDAGGVPHIVYKGSVGNRATGLRYATLVGGGGTCGLGRWNCELIDPNSTGSFLGLAVTNDGIPHISYSIGFGNSLDLYHATFVGSNGNCGSGEWSCTVVDSRAGEQGEYTAIALDSNGLPHIAYEGVLTSFGFPHSLFYARYVGNGGNCGSGAWNCEVVDDSSNLTTLFPSIVLDNNDIPHVAYHDGANRALRYATLVGSGGNCGGGSARWKCETVFTRPSLDTGLYTSIDLDSVDNIHISYRESLSPSPESGTKYAFKFAGTGNWSTNFIDAVGASGGYTSLVVDSGDVTHIVYSDGLNNRFRYATFGDTDGDGIPDGADPSFAIDIKPGSFPNNINIKSKGVIPVAILTTEEFDATRVDPGTVEFGPGAATEKHGVGHIEDVDTDGDADVVYHFPTQDSGIQCGDTEAMLTGKTFDGQVILGTDSIVTRGCK